MNLGGYPVWDDVGSNNPFFAFWRETDLESTAVLQVLAFAGKRS